MLTQCFSTNFLAKNKAVALLHSRLIRYMMLLNYKKRTRLQKQGGVLSLQQIQAPSLKIPLSGELLDQRILLIHHLLKSHQLGGGRVYGGGGSNGGLNSGGSRHLVREQGEGSGGGCHSLSLKSSISRSS